MSGLVFPNYLLGELFTQRKTPKFNTGVKKALSGKRSRVSFQAYPLYEYELSYELLRDDQSRTNFVTTSQDISQFSASASGTGFTPGVTQNYALAPDGTLTATRLVLNKGTGLTGNDFSIVSGAAVLPQPFINNVASLWMKSNDGNSYTVDVQLSYMGSGTFTITPQWQRFQFPCNGSYFSGGYNPNPSIFVVGSHPSDSQYADICAWGFQLEPGSVPTGLIPTYNGAIVASDLKTIVGLFNQMLGQNDSFLYSDPDFNTVSWQPFGVGNGVQQSWQLTAAYTPGGTLYQDYRDGGLVNQVFGSFPLWLEPNFGSIGSGFAGLAEIIQNPVGNPRIYLVRYGVLGGVFTPEMLNYGSHTNLIIQSQDMTQAAWTKNASGTGVAPTVTANFAAAPDGTTTATRVQFNKGAGNTNNDYSQCYQNVTGTNGALYTASVWLRSNDGLVHTMSFYSGGFAPQPNQVITVTPTWQRFYVSLQDNTAVGGAYVDIRLIGGFGNDTTADVLMWGAQIETGSYATSYIPTTTVAVTVPAEVTVGVTGLVTPQNRFATPLSGWQLLWSGSFNYRVCFSEDILDLAEFMHQFWELKKFSFEQIIL